MTSKRVSLGVRHVYITIWEFTCWVLYLAKHAISAKWMHSHSGYQVHVYSMVDRPIQYIILVHSDEGLTLETSVFESLKGG